MNKINIKDISLDIDMVQVLNIKQLQSTIYIDIDGNVYSKKEDTKNKAIIFKDESLDKLSSIKDTKSLVSGIFSDYKPQIIGTVCRIKPLANWQNIIDMNKEEMLYFDHQSDGVELFEDALLEDYGWHASALEINYRDISEFIEDNCEGTLLFYDNDVQFSGFAIINDIEDVRVKVKEFVITKAKKNLEDELIYLDDDDVVEAFEFFGCEV